MRDWMKGVIRLFGLLNLVFGSIGGPFVLDGLLRVSRVHHLSQFRYEPLAFDLLLTINALFIAGLILAGYWLLRLDHRGAVLSNYVFSCEILCFLGAALVVIPLGMSHDRTAREVSSSIAAVGGIGNMGTVLQDLTGYPIIGLVGLNLARRYMNRRRLWRNWAPSAETKAS